MPFTSKAQRRFMHMKHPEIAEKFEKETPKGAKLPEHKSDKDRQLMALKMMKK